MALSGVEYLEVCGPDPSLAVASSTDVVAVNTGTKPVGGIITPPVYAVMHVSTGEARLYSLPSITQVAGWRGGLVYYAGKFWVYGEAAGGNETIVRIDPAGWSADVIYSGGSASHSHIVGCNGYIVSATSKYHISSATRTGVTIPGKLGAVGTRLFSATGTTLYEFDVTGAISGGGSAIASWTLPVAVDTDDQVRGAPVSGGKVYFNTASTSVPLVGLDTVSDTTFGVAATPSGFSWFNPHWVAHSDGFLYRVVDSSGAKMQIFDPVTGRWALETFPTARGRRYAVASDGTNLWVPSGEPLDRS